MKNVCRAVVFALAAVLVAGVAQMASTSVEARALQGSQATTTMKGVIKTISDTSVVIVPATNKKAEVAFDLTSSVKREGALASGDDVAITYYYENGKRVVTEVAGKATSTKSSK